MKLQLSDGAKSLLEREREAVSSRVEDLRRQAASLHTLAEQVGADLLSAERLLRQIDEMLGDALQLPLDALHEDLRGARLREAAVAVLEYRRGAGAVIHYTEWLELLATEGIRIGGKNQAATLLTQIAKSERIESVRPRSGLYRLKPAA